MHKKGESFGSFEFFGTRHLHGQSKPLCCADCTQENHASCLQKIWFFDARSGPEQVCTSNTSNLLFNKPTNNCTWSCDNWGDLIQLFISEAIPKPQFVVFNEGLWPCALNETILHGTHDAFDKNDIVGICKMTTKWKGQEDLSLSPHDAIACDMFPCVQIP